MSERSVLVLGRTGQLARELARADWPAGWMPRFAGRSEIDLAEPEQAAYSVAAFEPDLVINAAGYTAVDKAESEPELAMCINAAAPGAIAAACTRHDIPFVTISTDHVFDGRKQGSYTEEDDVYPINAYGRSKAEGEWRVRDAQDWHLILRTSWVFSSFGSNFVRTMLRLARERESVSVVADQRGRPTAAGDLARAVIRASEAIVDNRELSGTYHVANAGAVSWHDFAVAIFEAAKRHGAPIARVQAITSADFPTPACRPANSELCTVKFERTFGMILRLWKEALTEVAAELLPATAPVEEPS